MALGQDTVDRIRASAALYPSKQSAILPALWAVQHEQVHGGAEGARARGRKTQK